MKLGDTTAKALASVGITEERVNRWLGGPCNCEKRRVKLNQLGSWVSRVLSGKMEKAEEHLETIMKE